MNHIFISRILDVDTFLDALLKFGLMSWHIICIGGINMVHILLFVFQMLVIRISVQQSEKHPKRICLDDNAAHTSSALTSVTDNKEQRDEDLWASVKSEVWNNLGGAQSKSKISWKHQQDDFIQHFGMSLEEEYIYTLIYMHFRRERHHLDKVDKPCHRCQCRASRRKCFTWMVQARSWII